MNADAKNPDNEDVYSTRTYIDAASTKDLVESCSIRLTAENSPLTLSRVYGLLATLTVVPFTSRTTIVSVDELAVELEFCDVSTSLIDRLCRKLRQTTEVAAVSTSDPCRGRTGH